MKKTFTFFAALFIAIATNAQSVDLALLGFVNEQNEPIASITLGATDALNPTVVLNNNSASGIIGNSDTVFFKVSIAGVDLFDLYLLGSQLTTLTPGNNMIIGGNAPLFTAEELNTIGLNSFTLCYTVRISSQTTTDPNSANNQACVNVIRTVGVESFNVVDVRVYPNPASSFITIDNAENAQITLFDLAGKMITTIESASANQTID
ncbi:MAG: T9SS type A sorting domain-containing protein, partial [Bacteroidales bacterium]